MKTDFHAGRKQMKDIYIVLFLEVICSNSLSELNLVVMINGEVYTSDC